MIVLKWVFPVSLAVLAIVHLVSCWRGDDDLRKPTKVALMPVVALAYLAFARMPSLWVVAGLLFGCLGDLFLLWPLKKKFFALGTSSFFLGHVCYLIFIYTHYVIRVSWIWIVVVCVIYAAGAAFVYANSRRNIPRALRPLALTYMLMLCVLSVSLILPLLTAFWWGKLVAFFGATFFLASDGVLCDMLFVKKAEPTQQNFVVMCTYILADAAGHRLCGLPVIVKNLGISKGNGTLRHRRVPFYVQRWKNLKKFAIFSLHREENAIQCVASTGGFFGGKKNMAKEKETENRSERERFLDCMLKEILQRAAKSGRPAADGE